MKKKSRCTTRAGNTNFSPSEVLTLQGNTDISMLSGDSSFDKSKYFIYIFY